MVDEVLIIHKLKEDADILRKSDAWLTSRQSELLQEIAIKVNELDVIKSAQDIKLQLQNVNMVPVMTLTEINGQMQEELIIMKIHDAVKLMDTEMLCGGIRAINASKQLACWKQDGYDIVSARNLIIS